MSGECDPISKMAFEIWKQREDIISLFCKTFFVSQNPRSLEELRALFEICELEVVNHSYLKHTYRIRLKNENGCCWRCKNELIACVCMLKEMNDER